MSPIPNLILPPLSLLYGVVTKSRLAAYKRGWLPTVKLDAPVISVGNLTTGGAGKTPLVEWVCRALSKNNRRPCVLTRGFRRRNPGSRVVVSDSSLITANVTQAGDEPLLLAQNLKGVAAVVCDADRAAAGKWAAANLGADVFVLDDGFQHLRLARDLNLLVIDATNPWGGGRLLPYGRLRESRSEAARADCIVITRADQSQNLPSLIEEIRCLNESSPILASTMRVKGITELGSNDVEELAKIPRPLGAFCAVGNPTSFFDQLSCLGLNAVLTQSFPDHHSYAASDFEFLNRKSREVDVQSLITTAKDAVKLKASDFQLPCYVLNIEISIEEDAVLEQMIAAAVRG